MSDLHEAYEVLHSKPAWGYREVAAILSDEDEHNLNIAMAEFGNTAHRAESPSEWLRGAFVWSYTARGEDYWRMVYDWLVDCEPLPPESAPEVPLKLWTKPAPVLPVDAAARKAVPVYSGVLAYFPLALAEIAKLSRDGNEQHNPGSPMHWDRSKSGDEKDALTRHLLQAGTKDTDGHWHDTKVAWRALANLQKLLESKHAE